MQKTPEWFQARVGHVTASQVSNVLAKPETAARLNYKTKLITERLTNAPTEEGFVSTEMVRGSEQESIARIVYETSKSVSVEECGFIRHPEIAWFGASPDGLVEDGLIEIKCPNTTTHLQYWMSGVVPTRYKPQMLAQLACTKRRWCDFVSFDNRLPSDMALFVVRYIPTDKEIADLEKEVKDFLLIIEQDLDVIQKKRNLG